MIFDYDAELRRYHEHFRAAAWEIAAGDRVLDIGCGSGQSTRDAARAAPDGSAVGVDISAPMLELARQRAAAEQVGNVTFALADAQRHPFADNHFAVAISRFGTMFFADPVVAFRNIGRAAARLVMLVWQAQHHQEWSLAISQAMGTAPATGGAFSLSDPATARRLLDTAGFTAIDLIDLREPVYYGPDADAAYQAVLSLQLAKAPLTADDRPRAADRLRETLAAHQTQDGVWFDSRAWLITARR